SVTPPCAETTGLATASGPAARALYNVMYAPALTPPSTTPQRTLSPSTCAEKDSRPRRPAKARPKAATRNKPVICATKVVVELPILFVANVASVSALPHRRATARPSNTVFIITVLIGYKGKNTISSYRHFLT